jgi:P27 family predicted phage terminase small subunit
MRGRKPVPTRLALLHGKPNHGRKINDNEPIPLGELDCPPDWLTPSQKEGWRYAICHAPPGLLRLLDRGMLTIWVVAEDTHRQASEKLQQTGLLTKFDGVPVPVQSPFLSIANKQATIMLRVASEMGFAPASRARVYAAAQTGTPSRTGGGAAGDAQDEPGAFMPLDEFLASAPPIPTRLC